MNHQQNYICFTVWNFITKRYECTTIWCYLNHNLHLWFKTFDWNQSSKIYLMPFLFDFKYLLISFGLNKQTKKHSSWLTFSTLNWDPSCFTGVWNFSRNCLIWTELVWSFWRANFFKRWRTTSYWRHWNE